MRSYEAEEADTFNSQPHKARSSLMRKDRRVRIAGIRQNHRSECK